MMISQRSTTIFCLSGPRPLPLCKTYGRLLVRGSGKRSRLSCLDSAIMMQASLSEMIPPGCLVMLSPVVVGILFGTRTLAGLLAGALVSGVQMAVSMSNTGGAWDNAKKYVEVSFWQGPLQSILLVDAVLDCS